MFYNQKPEPELKFIDLVSTCDVTVNHFKAQWWRGLAFITKITSLLHTQSSSIMHSWWTLLPLDMCSTGRSHLTRVPLSSHAIFHQVLCYISWNLLRPNQLFFTLILSFFFPPQAAQLVGSQFLDKGSNPVPWQQNHRVLSTEPPGNSPLSFFFFW